MPIDPNTAVTGGLQVLQSGGNMLFQNQQNRLNREFAQGQARLQRQYANEDWERTNAYNSPSAMKERFKAAGLNPNMMYSQGGGSNTAAMVRGSAPADYKGIAPQSNINFMSLMQLPLLMEQNRQLKLTNEAKMIDNQLLKEAVGLKTPTNNEFLGRDSETGDLMFDSRASYLKNNPYLQRDLDQDIKRGQITAQNYTNYITEATTESQINNIISQATVSYINAEIAKATEQTQKDQLQTALENAKNQGKIIAAQAKVADMEIGMTSQYYIKTIIEVLKLLK